MSLRGSGVSIGGVKILRARSIFVSLMLWIACNQTERAQATVAQGQLRKDEIPLIEDFAGIRVG